VQGNAQKHEQHLLDKTHSKCFAHVLSGTEERVSESVSAPGRVCCVVLCEGQPVAHTPEGDEGHPEDETAGAKVTGGAVTWEQAVGVRRAAARARVVSHKELCEEPGAEKTPGVVVTAAGLSSQQLQRKVTAKSVPKQSKRPPRHCLRICGGSGGGANWTTTCASVLTGAGGWYSAMARAAPSEQPLGQL
jgi:hypothetical protein